MDNKWDMLFFEKKHTADGYKCICGIDEAGRGPLAGPVVAASVVLPANMYIEGIYDSKELTPQQREFLFTEIHKHALSIGIGMVESDEIDKINILNATHKAMLLSVNDLCMQPDFVMIDGNSIKGIDIDRECIVKGDQKSMSIASASIIAKVTRDRIMIEIDQKYPEYGFASHKGYGTKAHVDAIRRFGLCPQHRVNGFASKFVR